MKLRSLIYAFVVLPLFSFSQTTDTKTAKIKELMDLTGMGQMTEQLSKSMRLNFKTQFSMVDSVFWDEYSKEMNPQEMINQIIPLYAKYYTEKDIDDLIIFVKSPAGRKMTAVMPMLMQESMALGREWAKSVNEKAIARLKAKGYLPGDFGQ